MPPLPAFDAAYHARGVRLLVGVDEAGRGCLAGPVVAAAVVLPPGADVPGLDDSKRLRPAQRAAVRARVEAVAWGVGVGACTPAEVDHLNVLHAALEAMRRAVEALADPRTGAPVAPDFALVDGNRLPSGLPCPAEWVVKGDGRSPSVAAASVVAKTERDALMRALAAAHPAYGWDANAGYPTAAHYAALALHGPTAHHRRTFRLA